MEVISSMYIFTFHLQGSCLLNRNIKQWTIVVTHTLLRWWWTLPYNYIRRNYNQCEIISGPFPDHF